MRIAVIGAGIAGLTVGLGLQKSGHDVMMYEQRADATSIGAGLTLFDNSFAALDLLGLGEAVRDVSSSDIARIRAGHRRPSGEWLLTLPQSTVASMRSVHRADLHGALLRQLEPETLRLRAHATVSSDGSPTVTLGEQSEQFDLVIAADGIRSRSRSAIGLDPGLRYAGFTAWRGVSTDPVDIGGEAGETWGPGQIFGIVPLRDGRIYWFGTRNIREGSDFADEREVVRHLFTEWHRTVGNCIRATSAENILRHDIYDLAAPLRSFSRGRTVLIGDAAHAMTPNLGQGAGQAIEDAATLVCLLYRASTGQVDTALAAYSELRGPRTRSIWRRSRVASRVAQTANPLLVSLRDSALRLTPGQFLGTVTDRLQSWPWLQRHSRG
ncbi:FAD-dependent monooxygenase [Brevibacterium atlanticum]|uniref:FAD-dependent monooxygenase n=1 Tax=Brevibacterium atlanticum TaxID=2697563 RepID=UPI001420B233